ncbi:transcriptional regulator [Candidatus Bathyarchaeota archaeon]|nr:MAG: transcriptional regulator [Candidatus Bathyarchaeota archaeon]
MKKGLAETCYLFFSVLKNPLRIAILELLLKEPLNVGEISTELNIERSIISHHLRILLRCKFVFVKRKWRERIYSVNKETVEPLLELIDLHAKRFGALNSR